jgi:Spy/CpxP family protein refolding chaperone
MRPKTLLMATAALMLAACGPAMDRGAALPPPTDPGLQPPPIYGLLGQRAELNLTSEQVSALDSLATAVTRENRPHLREIGQFSGPDGRRRATAEERARADTLIARIRANSRQAAEQAGEILTEEQRERVCALRETHPARGARTPRPAPRREVPTVRLEPIGWPWCDPPEGGETPEASANR